MLTRLCSMFKDFLSGILIISVFFGPIIMFICAAYFFPVTTVVLSMVGAITVLGSVFNGPA